MCVLSAETRLKVMIGNYVVSVAQLEAQTETLQEQVAKLTADLAAATGSPPDAALPPRDRARGTEPQPVDARTQPHLAAAATAVPFPQPAWTGHGNESTA